MITAREQEENDDDMVLEGEASLSQSLCLRLFISLCLSVSVCLSVFVSPSLRLCLPLSLSSSHGLVGKNHKYFDWSAPHRHSLSLYSLFLTPLSPLCHFFLSNLKSFTTCQSLPLSLFTLSADKQ
jgi:hypothetical protein